MAKHNGTIQDIRDGVTTNTLPVLRRLANERRKLEGSEREKRARMQARVEPIKEAARNAAVDRNNNRKEARDLLRSTVQFRSCAQVDKLLSSKLPVPQLLSMVKSQLKIYRDLLSYGRKVVVLSLSAETLLPNGQKKVKKAGGKELLESLCGKLKQFISDNIAENDGVFKPWQQVANDDAAPGCERYAEECEDPESDDDAVFAAAAAQHKPVASQRCIDGGCSDNSDNTGSDNSDSDTDPEPNNCLVSLGPSVESALACLKSKWASQLSSKKQHQSREHELKEQRYDRFQAMPLLEQLSALKKRWRSNRVGPGCPEFEEVESDMEGEEEYEPEMILKQRTRQKQVQYLVKWLGYSMAETTWEPPANIASHPGVIRNWKASVSQKTTNKKKVVTKRKANGAPNQPESSSSRSRRSCFSTYKR